MFRPFIILLALFQLSFADLNLSQQSNAQETFTKDDFMQMCTTSDRTKPEWKALVDMKYTLFMHCYNMKCKYPDWIFRTEEKECNEIYEYEQSSRTTEFHNGEIYDLSIMRFFPQIRYLEFENNNVTSIDFAKYLPKLKELRALSNPIQNIDSLKGKDMVILEVDGGGKYDISILSDMKNLEVLWIGGKHDDLTPIADLTKLRKLKIALTQNADICVLKNLKKLEKLYATHSGLTDISCLKNFPDMLWLGLNDNNLTTVKDIADNFPNLEVLVIEGNPITDLSPLTKLKKIRSVYADTDKLLSCSPKNVNEIRAGKSCDNFWLRRFIDWIRF